MMLTIHYNDTHINCSVAITSHVACLLVGYYYTFHINTDTTIPDANTIYIQIGGLYLVFNTLQEVVSVLEFLQDCLCAPVSHSASGCHYAHSCC